ncbi:glycosyltransferase family 2 protein [Gluconobacter kondonii]|uniref:glycosyltransferase family 2 protein n=1 Tax=Gluconobacter kondonii TaxID=941463 RepID=UPI001B8D0013|nr:glycosyltransferase family 2 protein [Gluconobacter kondonii]MBS1057634.1 glycosyltransferase family 2 protein [Gluconobacter kondonii]
MIICQIDEFSVTGIRGWATDTENPSEPVFLHALADGQEFLQFDCKDLREDVHASGVPSKNTGFHIPMPPSLLDGKKHNITFKNRLKQIEIYSQNQKLEHISFSGRLPVETHSFVDGLKQGVLSGWVVRGNTVEGWKGNQQILVTCNGQKIAQIEANRYRGDVGKALSCDPYCGFQFSPPDLYRKPYEQEFRFYVLPDMLEVANSPCLTSFVTDANEALIIDVIDQIDALHVELTRLRRKVREILPQPGFTIADYHSWATSYFPILRKYVDRTRNDDLITGNPLVSIVCPVWNPNLTDFTAAIESVRAQTWQNWELILVDDCSKNPELRAVIENFAKTDARIKPLFQKKNGGISVATNAGLEAAKGEWIAFFDHDDLLADVAVEYMLREATRSHADLIYSDEDKIDASGYYREPAFKTDWNYRLLLGVNYVCHFVMIRQSALQKVGGLNKEYDGAQDHDFLLRASEHIPAEKIHHVPEILYHWRITANSTASDIGNKRYAIDAGINAVNDHLERRNLPAHVDSQMGMTLYAVDWQFNQFPSVTIIIPYKDEIPTTARCLDAIQKYTRYPNYKVILVNNWSITKEAEDFAKRVDEIPNVEILTVKEPFNYSRINNLAAKNETSDFFLFLNNDVFVEQENWLEILVNEALADPQVAIVGGKFVYPNQTVQHAGVLLGIGDVAGHAHVGIPRNEGGYAGRAYFPQEISAVTAAGMLIRRPAFELVGGFDEEHLKVAFNDIDLCLKVRDAGYKIIWTPDFCAEHHESLSRGSDDRPSTERRFFHETQFMIEKWGKTLRTDPFYNPHFTLDRQVFFDLTIPGVDETRYPPLESTRKKIRPLWDTPTLTTEQKTPSSTKKPVSKKSQAGTRRKKVLNETVTDAAE